jgi:transcriptional regulator with XRE-family HTH domain
MDKVVGQNIRAARLAQGLSQSDLAEKLGITFQQVQKYEKGTNRVGAGRLFQVASIFDLPISSFFEPTGESALAKDSRSARRSDPLSTRLIEAFSRLPDSRSRLALLTVAESMNGIRKE